MYLNALHETDISSQVLYAKPVFLYTPKLYCTYICSILKMYS